MTRSGQTSSERRRLEEMRRMGENMRSRRLALKLSQDQVATALGVTQATVVRYEQGATEIPSSKLHLLWSILQTDANYLLSYQANLADIPEWSLTLARRLISLREEDLRMIAHMVEALADRASVRQ
jgi:transcriptional regulator with XRE-family HTH domain